ncbi:aspartyl-phosphate phosphatase Spo0E family protein [Calidifontibacillus oryziterrae]|uniref:aspartyl-phosphate phosphatase Spo0E family protein n=1 Tax=Calidifontibacillus oryziterrae TaxID=1191699 RepID=UPI0002E8E6E1|nr:aspartyl-phosphate phosphatase Spo0E family protein [Calidifontibacillus oryziterrae]
MANNSIMVKMSEEIEQLRQQLTEEWKQNQLLSHPSIVVLSQSLDVKINEYLKRIR